MKGNKANSTVVYETRSLILKKTELKHPKLTSEEGTELSDKRFLANIWLEVRQARDTDRAGPCREGSLPPVHNMIGEKAKKYCNEIFANQLLGKTHIKQAPKTKVKTSRYDWQD